MIRSVQKKAVALAATTLVVGSVVVSGCGNAELDSAGIEGHFIEAGQAIYQVQLSRLLNADQRPDDNLLEGQPPADPDQQYMAVFMVVQNKGKTPYYPPKNMSVVDTQGNTYLPQNANDNAFALALNKPIKPGGMAPPPDSPAAGGPDAASMVLFKLKNDSATTNLPLELRIPIQDEREPARVVLDL